MKSRILVEAGGLKFAIIKSAPMNAPSGWVIITLFNPTMGQIVERTLQDDPPPAWV